MHLPPNDALSTLLTVKPKLNNSNGIPGYIFKNFYTFASLPLTVIFNRSLSTALSPLDWKHATVTPFYNGKGPTIMMSLIVHQEVVLKSLAKF